MILRRIGIGILLILAIQLVVLVWFGQPLIAANGEINLWNGDVLSEGNSQHLTDWYTPSHIIHGILFYALLSFFVPGLSMGVRLLISLGVEAAWELSENTPWVINHYRQQALAQGYIGDSIVNSIMDSVAMIFGFLIARKRAVMFSIALVIIFEIVVGYFIHDNLTLNILNFIHPFDAVREWQLAPTPL